MMTSEKTVPWPTILLRALPPLCAGGLLVAAFWVIYVLAPEFHAWKVQGEDRAVEWITFAGFLLASLTCLGILRMKVQRPRWATCYFAGMALFFFLCAGEEISWGQRLIGFETPEPIAEVNEQGEFNLHNLDWEYLHPKDLVLFTIKGFGILLPLIFFKRMRRSGHPAHRYVPPLHLIPAFILPDIVGHYEEAIGRLVANRLDEQTGKFIMDHIGPLTEEVQEMLWGLAVLAAVLYLWSAWRGVPTPASGHRPRKD